MTCPCGTEKTYETCCGPYIAGAPAPTAEALMRSRYSAYVKHEIDYLMKTNAPETSQDLDRAATERWSRESEWLGLKIVNVVKGGEGDGEGEVEFTAHWRQGREDVVHHERSKFRKQDGRWLYVDGITPKREPERRDAAKLSPNAPCHCGSGKKFKRCHGI